MNKTLIVIAGLIMTSFLGFLETRINPNIFTLAFYLIPVYIVAWYAGKNQSMLISLYSAFIWLLTKFIYQPHIASMNPDIFYWNVFSKLFFLLLASYLFARLHENIKHEENMSRTDYLTGISNRRYFYEMLKIEIERKKRYKTEYSVVFMDIDRFKSINDILGHPAGDNLLRIIADVLKNNIRFPDLTARIGGDEFGILLAETGYEGTKITIERLLDSLNIAAKKHRFPVQFSMGVLVCGKEDIGADKIIKLADSLMYKAKKGRGKEKIRIEYFR
ncbi:MAG: diguanylate cyclase [Elusimicrobiota bacterium]